MGQKATIEQLCSEGYAVIIMSPNDLQGADVRRVESRGVDLVNSLIEELAPAVSEENDEIHEPMRG